jgi:hypothetical protein
MKLACCFPIMRTAGWYHSNFCSEHAFEKLTRAEKAAGREALHDRDALRAETARSIAAAHDWARCDVYQCARCEYVEAWMDRDDDRFPA